jgi:RNA polymerase sigma-70 factor (ECF subfamily)
MAAGFSAEQLQAQIPRLRRYARALTGGRDGADDLVQDTLERAWTKRALWDSDVDGREGSLKAWLHAVMHNLFINGIKRARKTESLDEEDESAALIAAPAVSAETGAALRDLQRALARLSDEQREVVLLVGMEQLSYAEAAQALGVPIGTVMSRLSRGRERLRQLMEEPQAAAQAGLRRVK